LILELVFSHNVDNSDGEWDEPSPQEYDIFGDAQPPDASLIKNQHMLLFKKHQMLVLLNNKFF